MQDKNHINNTKQEMADTPGTRIRLIRKCLGASQGKMAKELGLSRYTSLARYEAGSRKPNHSILVSIGNLGRTSVDWILTGKIDSGLCDLVSKVVPMDRDSLENLAKAMKVSAKLLSSFVKQEISPSVDFVSSLYSFTGTDTPRGLFQRIGEELRQGMDSPDKHYFINLPSSSGIPSKENLTGIQKDCREYRDEKIQFYEHETTRLQAQLEAVQALYRDEVARNLKLTKKKNASSG